MAYTERVSRTGILAEVIRGIVEAAQTHSRTAARRRAGRARRHSHGSLDAGTLRDIGAHREFQDYASSVGVPIHSNRRFLGHLRQS